MKPFEKKIWLASPTMHGEEQKYVKEAFDTNWVSTVGANLEHLEKVCGIMWAVRLPWHFLPEPRRFIWR